MPDPDVHATTYGLGASDITFRPVTRDDFALLHRWLVTPEVRAWWRSQTRTLEDVEREYGPQVDGADPTRSFVIQADDTPVGMIQCYRHADYPNGTTLSVSRRQSASTTSSARPATAAVASDPRQSPRSRTSSSAFTRMSM
jgi:Acetyltransferase (GNAT) domain